MLILLLNPVYVTLFWALVLHVNSPATHYPKIFLSRFMGVAFILYVSHLFFFLPLPEVYLYLDAIYLFCSLLVFPLYHIYVRLLTVESRFKPRLHVRFLLVPLLVFVLYGSGYLVMNAQQAAMFLNQVVPGNINPEGILLYMYVMYLLSRVVFVAQVFVYLYLNFRLIRTHNTQLQNFYSNPETRRLHWVQFFNISMASISIASIMAAVFGREAFTHHTNYLAAASLVFSGMLFAIGLLGNKQNEVITETGHLDDLPEPAETDHAIHHRLQQQMVVLFEKEKIFLNPDLKIWDVAAMLGTNRTYVSRTINMVYNCNFCSQVNQYRVNHAKQLIGQTPQLTNEQIAELSGFGSVNSLYRAFKAMEDKPLSELRKASLQN